MGTGTQITIATIRHWPARVVSRPDGLIVSQAARMVRAFERFEAARGAKSRQLRGGELKQEIRALKRLFERKAEPSESQQSRSC